MSPSTPTDPVSREKHLERAQETYQYKEAQDNQVRPIAIAGRFPCGEKYGVRWAAGFLPGAIRGVWNWLLKALLFRFEKATWRFDKLRAYEALFPGKPPGFVDNADSDAAFAWRRIAGPNALSIRQERDFIGLCSRIDLKEKLPAIESLAEEAQEGRLFVVDFSVIQRALEKPRDSRWRNKYLPVPIGVFLEAPGFHAGTDLVPLAIQIDRVQPNGDYTRVYIPSQTQEEKWGWRLAKLYFEAADVSFHVGCGHVFRTHLLMEPFALATPRQLPPDHPVFILLQPHLRHTLATNKAAYNYFTNRKKTYFKFYSGTLEDTRNLAIRDYREHVFHELGLEADLADRNVQTAPADYPYRDDALLWLGPIHRFVKEYISACYPSDSELQNDEWLQGWAEELMDPERGAIHEMLRPTGPQEIPTDRPLDTREKLIDLLAQVLFIAGPGHASQHFSSSYFYRYSPAFPGAAWAPPPRKAEEHGARYERTLAPIDVANLQFFFNTFTDYRFDRFGHYDGYELGSKEEAHGPIKSLQKALGEIEAVIELRADDRRKRMLPYDFLLPKRVPNSVNV